MAKQRLRGTYVFPAGGASQANVDKTISEATEEIKSVVYKSVAGLEVESNKTASVDHNGTVVVTPSDGKDAMEKATVTVAVPLESNKEVSITQNGTTLVQPSSGKDGMEKVTVNVNVSGGGGADLEDNKEVSITENGTVEITPTAGKDGMKKVTATVNVSGGGGVSKLYYANDPNLEYELYLTKDPATLQVGDNVIILQYDLRHQTYSVTITNIYPSEDFEGFTEYDFEGDWQYHFAWQPSFSENDINLV